jgi:hypothetical protein
MSDDEQKLMRHTTAEVITWFAPDRPVSNGTVYVRPETVMVCDDTSEILTEH